MREYTAAYVKTGGQFDAFRRGIGDIARKHNITNATIAGGHGTTAKQADIGPALAAN